jgi:uncharacterized tellurite resistance protein B-like protein
VSNVSLWASVDPAAIAFLFVACARTDDTLSEPELVRLVERVAQWMPGATREQLHAELEKGVSLYRSAPDRAAVQALVTATAERLRERLEASERERLVTELIGLSQADGEVDVSETDLVLAIAKCLDVEVALADD